MSPSASHRRFSWPRQNMGCGPEKWGGRERREGTLIEMSPFWNKYGNESRKGRRQNETISLREGKFYFPSSQCDEALMFETHAHTFSHHLTGMLTGKIFLMSNLHFGWNYPNTSVQQCLNTLLIRTSKAEKIQTSGTSEGKCLKWKWARLSL